MPTLAVVPEGISIELREGRRSWKASSEAATPTESAVARAAARSAWSTSSKGEVEYNRTVADEVLSDEDKRHGACLSCRAVAVTDVTISLREETLRTVNPLMALYSASQADGLTHHPLHGKDATRWLSCEWATCT